MRIYKTRSIATDACKKGRITMAGKELKPSRTFKMGDVFSVRKGPITYTYKVLRLSENRLGAKLVPDYMQDITAPEQLEILELARLGKQSGRYERIGDATGHPTKKDRREYEQYISPNPAPFPHALTPLGREDRFAWLEDEWDEELDALDEMGFDDL